MPDPCACAGTGEEAATFCLRLLCEHVFVLENAGADRLIADERAINRRVQGDLGEFSAMEWLASQGAPRLDSRSGIARMSI